MNNFHKKGYILIKNCLSKDLLNELKKESENMFAKAKKNLWPLIRVYNDYPYFNKNINVFGLDYPLNNKLNNNIFKLFNRLNYGKELIKISNWKTFKTTVIRLHAFNNLFNYQGVWHRDGDTFPTPNQIQSVIYLKEEKGFRIVPKDKNYMLEQYGFSLTGQPDGENLRRANLPKSIFDVINAEAGDVLFFEAALLHQGFSRKERMHYHLRHVNTSDQNPNNLNINNKENIFFFEEEYLPDYNFEKLFLDYKKYEKKNDYVSKFKRSLRYIFYFLPRFKSLFRNIFKNKAIKETLFHSTFYQ